MADWTQPPPAGPKDGMSWLDRQFSQTSLFVLVLAGLCCAGPAFIFGVFGSLLCTDPKAKKNAIVMTVVSGSMTIAAVVAQVVVAAMSGEV